MRRKILQDFTNVFSQRLIDLPAGHDLAFFAQYGSGKYTASILTGECTFSGKPIPSLQTCEDYKRWLFRQLDKHRIAKEGIQEAVLVINVTVGKVKTRSSDGRQYAEAHFAFDCKSEIRTDEKSYKGSCMGEKNWRFDADSPRLHGPLARPWQAPLSSAHP